MVVVVLVLLLIVFVGYSVGRCVVVIAVWCSCCSFCGVVVVVG